MNSFCRTCTLFFALSLLIFHFQTASLAVETGKDDSTPSRTIAYLEPGHFWLYVSTYDAFKKALEERNIRVAYPEHLHFSLDWNAGPEQMQEVAQKILDAHPDMVIAAGTAAVRAMLAVSDGHTPILGIALADPLAAGLVASVDDSGADNFTCEVIPDRWQSMYKAFHEVIRFRTLGIMYPAGPEGRIYAGADDAMRVGRLSGFAVIEEVIPDESMGSCQEGLRRLHERGIDAFFIGPLNCFDWSATDPTPLFELLNKTYQIPTFARDGSVFVQGGALMGFATWDFTPSGRELADKAIKIFNGVKPRDISMRAFVEPLIALNLQTAKELGIDLPFDVLIAADEIYETTIKPNLR